MEASVVPVSQPRSKRQYRTTEQRRRIVEETMAPGVSVATIARAHGVNANQVFAWRKMYQAGLLRDEDVGASSAGGTGSARLLPVAVSAEVECAQSEAAVSMAASPQLQGSIELTLARAQIRITGQVDEDVLRTVLECLRG